MRKSYLSQTWWRMTNFSTQETEARGVRVQRQKFVQNRKVQAKIEKKKCRARMDCSVRSSFKNQDKMNSKVIDNVNNTNVIVVVV